MSDLRALDLAADMALRERDEVARTLAQRRGQRQMAVQQLEQLQAYVLETENKWMDRQSASAAAVLHHHYQFLGKLDHAIAYQQRVIQGQDMQLAQVQQALLEAEHKLNRFEHVLKRKRAEIALRQERQVQKQMDEMATNMVVRKARRQEAMQQAEKDDAIAQAAAQTKLAQAKEWI